ncbi:hypothetical protein C8R44DRAFT_958086 [Mycena epipterygia]|nr:hypothetical protein C8R44DRAFT_958086 [Mycena epipterygia]
MREEDIAYVQDKLTRRRPHAIPVCKDTSKGGERWSTVLAGGKKERWSQSVTECTTAWWPNTRMDCPIHEKLPLQSCHFIVLEHIVCGALTSALNITVASQLKAPGPILLQLATDPTDPDPSAECWFFVSNSVNISFPPYAMGWEGVNMQVQSALDPHSNSTFNLPPLPEGGGWVITTWIFSGGTGPAPAGLQNDPKAQEGTIIGTSNAFSVTPGPQPKSTEAVSSRKSFPVGAIVGLSIRGVVIIAAIAGLIIIRRRSGSTRRSPSSVEDGRLRDPAPWASTASLDSLPEKAPWDEDIRLAFTVFDFLSRVEACHSCEPNQHLSCVGQFTNDPFKLSLCLPSFSTPMLIARLASVETKSRCRSLARKPGRLAMGITAGMQRRRGCESSLNQTPEQREHLRIGRTGVINARR